MAERETSVLINQLRGLAAGKRIQEVSITRDHRRVSRWWLGCVADRLEELENMLDELITECLYRWPSDETVQKAKEILRG